MKPSNRPTNYARVHDLLVRISTQAGGKAQSLTPSVSSTKPGSSIPDFQVVKEQKELLWPLNRWLEIVEAQHQLPVLGIETMARWHGAVTAATDAQADNLIERLTETETRMRIEWKGERYHAMQESPAELRVRRERTWLDNLYGFGTTEAAALVHESAEAIRHVREKHGVSGKDGHRIRQCPEMERQRSSQQCCAVCAIVDSRDGLAQAA